MTFDTPPQRMPSSSPSTRFPRPPARRRFVHLLGIAWRQGMEMRQEITREITRDRQHVRRALNFASAPLQLALHAGLAIWRAWRAVSTSASAHR